MALFYRPQKKTAQDIVDNKNEYVKIVQEGYFLHFMRVIATTEARKNLSEIVNQVRYTNKPVIVGRHGKGEVVIIKFPQEANSLVDEMTNMNQYGGSFDFLEGEPEIYSAKDLKKSYV